MAKTKTRQERMAEEAKVAATAAQALQVVEAAVAAEAAYSAQAVTAQPNTAEPEEAGPSTSAPLQNPQSSTIMINPPTAPPPPVLQVTDFRCSVAACMLCDHVQQAMHSELFCFNIKTCHVCLSPQPSNLPTYPLPGPLHPHSFWIINLQLPPMAEDRHHCNIVLFLFLKVRFCVC